MFQNILVLCLGNICRSPVAEALLRKKLQTANLKLRLDSAGLSAMVGDGAHPFSMKIADLYDLELEQHRAKQLTEEMTKTADLILVMDDMQRRMVEEQFKGTSGKTFRLGHFGNFDIPDPYGKDFPAFEIMYHQVDRSTEEWLQNLK